ncbi:F-box/LRR-repeat protein 5 [Portunus trituberculatus]|uniref:F-box/LRR-repeat protein 5 n=1 Tax=Portunus trituberculatus TaxID=210409 RepID=A0A5B7GH25_PORTR|nr:F-box/LRR-repeat protein 5 [Portunus trituberculatus]
MVYCCLGGGCWCGQVVQLVRRGTQVRERSVGERITFGQQLQEAFQAFVNTFLPHMEEEEQVFQPMLVEYFDYEELKVLREIVLKEHELAKERWHMEKAQDLQEGQPETHSSVKDLRDLDWDLCSLTGTLDELEAQDGELGCLPPPLPLPPEQPPLPPDHSLHPHTPCHTLPHLTQEDSYSSPYPDPQTDNYLLSDYQDLSFDSHTHHIPTQDHSLSLSPYSVTTAAATAIAASPALPTDVLVEIFRYLTPPDLGRCAQVCSAWNSAVFSPTLWPAIFPVQWARGVYVCVLFSSTFRSSFLHISLHKLTPLSSIFTHIPPPFLHPSLNSQLSLTTRSYRKFYLSAVWC